MVFILRNDKMPISTVKRCSWTIIPRLECKDRVWEKRVSFYVSISRLVDDMSGPTLYVQEMLPLEINKLIESRWSQRSKLISFS